MRQQIKCEMARGGFVIMTVDGSCRSDSLGSGEPTKEIEDMTISWPGGGEVAPELLADLGAVKDAFWKAEESRWNDPY